MNARGSQEVQKLKPLDEKRKPGRERHYIRWSSFQNEEVQHEAHVESDPGK